MDDFTRSLVAFTVARKCSRNWLRTVVEWIHTRCPHPPEDVTADLLEGDALPTQIHKCRVCGASWRAHHAWPDPR